MFSPPPISILFDPLCPSTTLCRSVPGHWPGIGSTSARCSGTVWIPGCPDRRAAGVTDDRAQAERYLASLVGNRGETALWQAFLDSGPLMLADLRDRAGIGFRPFMKAADYRQDRKSTRLNSSH